MWRAGTEVALAATFVVFLFAYLNLNRWHGHFSYGALVWILGLVLIAGVAIVDPAVAAGIARLSFAATALTGPRPDHLPRHTRLRPRHHAGAQLGHGAVVAMRDVDGDHRHARQRHCPAGARRRADPDHPADRLHRHAACLCRRRAASGPVLRPRAAGAGRRRIGRHGVGLGRAARPRRHQARCQHPARPCAQQPRRGSPQLAAGAALRRPRHIPHDARRGARTSARPGIAELPAARRRRALSLVFAARAAGDRIGWRGHPLRRHHGRRDGAEKVRGKAAARRRARQSDRPAEPRTVHEPAGSDHLDRADGRKGAPDRLRRRHRPLQAGQ